MKIVVGNCFNCGKEIFYLDEIGYSENINEGCRIHKNNKNYGFYVFGDYGSVVFDLDIGEIVNKELINKLKELNNPLLICDDCIRGMLDKGDIKKTEEPFDFENDFDIEKENNSEKEINFSHYCWDPEELAKLQELCKIKTPYFNDPDKLEIEELLYLWKTCFEFLLPRLKKCRHLIGGDNYPHELGSIQKWKEVINEMIWYVETTIENNNVEPKEEKERYRLAKELFFKYFFHLWG